MISVGSSGNIETRSGDITVKNTAERIQTEGTYSPGLTIQSIGGGGGFALIDARSKDETRIGAVDSNSDSASGSIKLTNNSDIVTLNRSSNALTVQTISSGGGVINSSSGNLSLGSKNVAGNDTSGSIDITNTGSITTLGARSSGLLVQSISSGGGVVAGRSLNGELVLGSTEENQTSNNDDSGGITVTNTATSITTYGRDSNAFVVQSIAGGGGYVARSEEKLTLGSTNETNVNSGDLDVYNASTINTFGNASAGLIAQTVSGGGGFVGAKVGNGGAGRLQMDGYAHSGAGGLHASPLPRLDSKFEIVKVPPFGSLTSRPTNNG